MRKVELVPNYWISPVIKGGWQLSSGHSLDSVISQEQAITDIVSFLDSGIFTLDFGDIYTGVEELVGRALRKIIERDGAAAREQVQLHTKYVPNEKFLDDYQPNDAREIVSRSLERLGVEQVDLVQFHWWRYEAQNYLRALEELFHLKEEGLIREVGVTNFDQLRLAQMVGAGLKPASIQLQYSLLDRRPESGMIDFCLSEGIGVLCYGTVAGGFISEKYLGAPEPTKFETRSNIKYRLIIAEFGGWELFQQLLRVLNQIAINHQSDIATISSAFTLSQPGVSAVIVGARNVNHLAGNLRIPEITLASEEREALGQVLARSLGPTGEVFELERHSDKHRNIMHTNNN